MTDYNVFAQVGPPATAAGINGGYSFAQTSGTYTPLSASRTIWQSNATLGTDAVSPAVTLPWNFSYNGRVYSSIRISNNGFITFGANPPLAATYTALSTNVNPAFDGSIAGFAVNLRNANVSTSEISYETVGSTFVIQFTDLQGNAASAAQLINFQIILSQTTNTVAIQYGTCASGTATLTGQVGLKGGESSDVNNRTGVNWSATTPGTSITSNCTLGTTNGTTVPASGLTYTYTPGTWLSMPATYASIPFTENFSTWVNGNTVADLPNTANWRSWPSRSDVSWRANNTVATGFTSTTGWEGVSGSATIAAPAVVPTARFHSFNASNGSYGYMDLYLDLSTGGIGTRTFSFDYRNPSGVDNLQLQLSTDGGVTFTTLGAAITTNAGWTNVSRTTLSTSSTAVLRFLATSDFGADDIYIDNLTVTVVGCAAPGSLTASSITSSSATLGWFEGGTATVWDIESGVSGFIPTGVPTAASVTNPYVLGGLSANTTYQYYVRANCGASQSTWTGPFSFTTLCASAILPYSESFESAVVPALPACVTSSHPLTRTTTTTGAAPRTGTKYQNIRWTPTVAKYLYSAPLDLTAAISYDMGAWYLTDGIAGWNSIRLYANSSASITGATLLTTVNNPNNVTYQKLKGSYTPSTTGAYFFIIEVIHNGVPNDMSIDDMFAEITPACSEPASLAVSSTTNNSATVSWTSASAPSSGYDYYLSTSSTAPDAFTTPTGNVGVATVNLSSLPANTLHYFWVRSNCTSEQTIWVGTTFSTQLVVPAPYTEGFATTTAPAGYGGNMTYGSSTGAGGNPGNTVYSNLYSFFPASNVSTVNVGPVTASQVLSFDYRLANFGLPYDPPASGSGNYVVQISTDFGATYSTLETVANDGVAGWRTKSYPMTSYSGQIVKLRILGNWISGDYYLAFDNIKVVETCTGTPDGGTSSPATQSVCTGLPAAALTVTGATIADGITYQWEESTDGGASWANATGGTGATTTSYTPPVYAGTVIQYRLAVTCTNSSSTVYSSVSVINDNANALPLAQPFDDLATLAGWVQTGGYAIGATRGVTGNPGPSAYSNLWGSNQTNSLRTAKHGPVVAGQVLSFDLQLSNYGTPYDPPAAGWGSLTVEISTDCGLTFAPIGTISAAPVAGYVNYKYNLAPYVGQDIVARVSGAWIAGDYDVSLDNIVIDQSAPVITSFTPANGCTVGGDVITISGFGFSSATQVQFNGVNAVSFAIVDDSTITAITPAALATGFITVTNSIGTGTSANALTINATPEVDPIVGDTAICLSSPALALTNNTPLGVWSSSNSLIATVDTVGNVLGLAEGTVTISYTSTVDGCSATVDHIVDVYAPVLITTQPTPQSVIPVSGLFDATFSIAASGSGITYQWEESVASGPFTAITNGGIYSGANSNMLVITQGPDTMNGNVYRCVVSGTSPCSPETSNDALLTVGSTSIVTNPSNFSLCDSGTATFTVVATGVIGGYEWYENGSGTPIVDGGDYSGATTATLTIANRTTANDGDSYSVTIAGSSPVVSSTNAILSVATGVGVDLDPIDQTVCYSGGTATFVVAGLGTISGYNWQYSDGVNPFANVVNGTPAGATYSGDTTDSLVVTTDNTLASGTHLYRAVINGNAPCTSVNTASANLLINTPSVTNPSAVSLFAGATANFSATPTATGTVTTQWQYATSAAGPYSNVVDGLPTGVTYSGATSASLDVITSSVASASSDNYYRLVVTSDGCEVASNGAQLTINNYCTPTIVTSGASYYDSFSTTGGVTNINNSASGFSTNGYGNFSAQSVSQFQNSTVNFATTIVGATVGCAVWVDWDQNGVFDATERVANTTSYISTFAGSFVVPATAAPGTTRMRVMIDYWNSNPADPCVINATGPRGEVEDYTFEVLAQPACSGTPTAATISTTTPAVCFSGTSTLVATGYNTVETGISLQWYNSSGLISGAESATYITPVLTAPETYYVRVTCANGGEFADSDPITIGVNNPSVDSTTPDSRCGTGTVDLEATGSLGSTLNWYDAAAGGTLLGSGSPFTTPSIAATTTYYVAASNGGSSESIGKASSPGTDGTYLGTDTGLVFDASSSLTIASATIYPVGTGTLTVAVYDSAGTELSSTSAIPVSGTGVATPVSLPIGLTVPAGTGYRLLVKASTGITGLIRDFSGNVFPYNSASASITGGYISGASTTYYFFYNLNLTTGCESARTAVTATVTAPPALSISTSDVVICSGDTSSVVTVTSTVGDYTSYSWSPATGVSGNENTGWTFNPTTSTVYTLTSSETVNGCANQVTLNVTVNPLPLTPIVSPAAPAICSSDAPVLLTLGVTNPTPSGTCLDETFGQFPAGEYTPVTCDGSTPNVIVTNAWTGEYTLVNAAANTLYTFTSTGAGDYVTISDATGTTTLAYGPSPISWYSSAASQVRFYSQNSGCTAEQLSRTRSIICTSVNPVVFTPAAGLFTDAAGTTAYDGVTPVTSIYAKPIATATYTATATNGFGCSISSDVTVTVTPASTWYQDLDGDGFGNPAVTQLACVQPVGYVADNTDCDGDTNNNPSNTCDSVVNLKLFIEGYYDGSSTMKPVKNNQDFVSPTTDVADITVELYDAGTFALVATTTAVLKTDGTAVCTFATAPSGSFYLTVKGGNFIQTWTASPVTVGSTPLTYDFSDAANKAYGDNMVLLGSGVYGFFSGDLNADGSIDNLDYSLWETDANNFSFGVFATDLNGDASVDNLDYSIWETNSNNFVFSVTPTP